MKIAWIADFTVESYRSGGAQHTNKMYIEEGKARGHKIDIFTEEFDLVNNYDFYILNNITRFSSGFLDKIINGKINYMRIEHDYHTLNNINSFQNLFKNSFLNIFMSKVHMMEYLKKIGVPNADYVTSPVDTKNFIPDGKKDNRMVIWVGNFSPHKGVQNILDYAKLKPKWTFYLFGKNLDPINLNRNRIHENCKIIGEVGQVELIKYYQKARYVIHLPNWIEPTGRSVMEGYLCGCDLIVNGRVGFMHEDWDWNDYEEIKSHCKTEKELWVKIEDKLGRL